MAETPGNGEGRNDVFKKLRENLGVLAEKEDFEKNEAAQRNEWQHTTDGFSYRKSPDENLWVVEFPKGWSGPPGSDKTSDGRIIHTVDLIRDAAEMEQYIEQNIKERWPFPRKPEAGKTEASNPNVVQPNPSPENTTGGVVPAQDSLEPKPAADAGATEADETSRAGTQGGDVANSTTQDKTDTTQGAITPEQTSRIVKKIARGRGGINITIENTNTVSPSGGVEVGAKEKSAGTKGSESASDSYKVPEGKEALYKEFWKLDALEDALYTRVRNGESGAAIADELVALKRQKNAVVNTLFKDLDAQIVARKEKEATQAVSGRIEGVAANPEQNQMRQGTVGDHGNAANTLRIADNVAYAKYIAEKKGKSEGDISRWMSAPKRWAYKLLSGAGAGLFAWSGKAFAAANLSSVAPALASFSTQVSVLGATIPLSAPAVLGIVGGILVWQGARRILDLHKADELADAGWQARKLEKGMKRWQGKREKVMGKYGLALKPGAMEAEREARYIALQSKWKKVSRLQNVPSVVGALAMGGWLEDKHSQGDVSESLRTMRDTLGDMFARLKQQFAIWHYGYGDCQNAIQEFKTLPPLDIFPPDVDVTAVPDSAIESPPSFANEPGIVAVPEVSPDSVSQTETPASFVAEAVPTPLPEPEIMPPSEPQMTESPAPATPEPIASEPVASAEQSSPPVENTPPTVESKPPTLSTPVPEAFPGVDFPKLENTFHHAATNGGIWDAAEKMWASKGFSGDKLTWLTDMVEDYTQDGSVRDTTATKYLRPGLLDSIVGKSGVTQVTIPTGAELKMEHLFSNEEMYQDMIKRISQAPYSQLSLPEKANAMSILKEWFEGSQQLLKLRPSVTI